MNGVDPQRGQAEHTDWQTIQASEGHVTGTTQRQCQAQSVQPGIGQMRLNEMHAELMTDTQRRTH